MEIPAWLENAGQDVYGKAKNIFDTPFQPYTADRVAAPVGDQQNAFQMLRDFNAAGGTSGTTQQGIDLINRGAGYRPSTERIVDENGRLGKMADYTNPYTDMALAPTIRALERDTAQRRMRLGDRANSAGAFGDARHGVLENVIDREGGTAVGDATYRAFADAFDKAMGLRGSDLARFTAGDESAATRDLAAGGSLVDAAGKQQSDFMSRLTALLTTGGIQQQYDQSGMDAGYEDFLRKQQDPFSKLAALVSTIGGTPYSKTETTTKDDGGAGMLSLLGAALGAI
jgi:hypothetical protein